MFGGGGGGGGVVVQMVCMGVVGGGGSVHCVFDLVHHILLLGYDAFLVNMI